jgi:hypothetical protein
MQSESKKLVKSGRVKADVYIGYDITYRCNLRCEYCYVLHKLDNKLTGNKFIATIVLLKLKRFLSENKDKTVEFDILGGEPLSYKGLTEYVHKLEDIRLEYNNLKIITITTHGVFPTPPNFNDIGYNNNISFQVSYHNYSNNIKLLKENLLKFLRITDLVTLTIHLYDDKLRIQEIRDIIEFCNSNHIHTCTIDINDLGNDFKMVNNSVFSEISDLTSLDNIKNYQVGNTEMTRKNIHDINWIKGTMKYCNLSCFNIDYYGDITADCNYTLDRKNITTSNIELYKVYCKHISCMGGSGLDQKKAYV